MVKIKCRFLCDQKCMCYGVPGWPPFAAKCTGAMLFNSSHQIKLNWKWIDTDTWTSTWIKTAPEQWRHDDDIRCWIRIIPCLCFQKIITLELHDGFLQSSSERSWIIENKITDMTHFWPCLPVQTESWNLKLYYLNYIIFRNDSTKYHQIRCNVRLHQ